MECKVCGRHTSSENANFCEYCGNSLRGNFEESTSYKESNTMNDQAVGNVTRSNYNNQSQQPQGPNEEPISFKNWILTLLIPFIPVFGGIVYLVMLFVWAFSNQTQTSKKNWARASLIITLITFIIGIYLLTSFFGSIMSGTFPLGGLDQFY